MATKKTVVSQLPEAASLENLWVYATDNLNNSVKAAISLLKGNVGNEGDKGDTGTPGAPGKAPRVNSNTGTLNIFAKKMLFFAFTN